MSNNENHTSIELLTTKEYEVINRRDEIDGKQLFHFINNLNSSVTATFYGTRQENVGPFTERVILGETTVAANGTAAETLSDPWENVHVEFSDPWEGARITLIDDTELVAEDVTTTTRRNIQKAAQEWDSSIDFAPRSNTYKLLRALLSEADRIDDSLDNIDSSHYISGATGKELEQFGKLVNVQRNNNEADEKYRTRIKAEFAQSSTETTFEDFVEFTASVLGTNVDNIDFITNYEAQPATVTIFANSSIYESVSLTAAEIADILGGGVPAGHRVLTQESGTFRLKSDGEQDDAGKGLTANNIETGGTLAADLVE